MIWMTNGFDQNSDKVQFLIKFWFSKIFKKNDQIFNDSIKIIIKVVLIRKECVANNPKVARSSPGKFNGLCAWSLPPPLTIRIEFLCHFNL